MRSAIPGGSLFYKNLLHPWYKLAISNRPAVPT